MQNILGYLKIEKDCLLLHGIKTLLKLQLLNSPME